MNGKPRLKYAICHAEDLPYIGISYPEPVALSQDVCYRDDGDCRDMRRK